MNATPVLRLPPELSRRCHSLDTWRHGVRLLCFVGLAGLGAVGAILLNQHLPSPWNWLASLPCSLVTGAALHGISLFTHEAVHGTLLRQRRLNDLLGALCAWPVLQNCSAYRVLHLNHHQHLGAPGDPDHYENYTRWSWGVFTLNWLRLLVGYPVYLVAIPVLGFRQGNRRDRWAIATESTLTVALVGAVLASPVPGAWLLHGWLVPMLFINTFVNVRGMSQHTLLEHASDEIRGTRSILTSPLVRFFMCNENYHLEHHLFPGVPWHHLPELHQALRNPLTQAGAPYIPSYTAFVGEFIRHSWNRSPWGRRRAPTHP
jgi:fatty acid desaturase